MIEKLLFKKRIIVTLIVLCILGLAFFLRIYFSFNIVFSNPIKYAGDDGIYHMRIIENELLGDHFPRRIYFDPYTNFPNGTYIHFAPLYDQLLSLLIWFLTFGQPTQSDIDIIAPFYPPILGILVVLVIYFLGKILWGSIIGAIAALLAAISPILIFRSLLGETDHHISEALFSSIAILCLFFLLKFQEKKESYSVKWWFLTILAGIALGLYFLMWEGALLFLAIFFIFFVSHSVYEYLNQRPWRHILASGAVIFSIVLMMLVPYLGHPNLLLSPLYSLRHIYSIIFSLFIFLVIWLLGEIFSRKKIKKILFLPLFFLISLIIVASIYFIFPEALRLLLDTFKAVNTSFIFNDKARELVSEMRPLQIQGAIDIFLGLFFFSLGGLIMIIYNFIKKYRSTDLFIIIWFFVVYIISGIFPTLVGQLKYMYYLWVVVALLSAFFIWRVFIFGWKGLKIVQEKNNKNHILFTHALIGSLLIIFSILVFLLYPFPFNLFASYPKNLPQIIQSVIISSTNVIQHPQDWYDSLKWLRENTPVPSLNYYSLYKEPEVDLKTNKIIPYSYPPDSYGVLARWDKGHAITYYAQRMAVANPFQQGIGRKKDGKILELGEGVFFLETNEEAAINYLDQLKVRYLITDANYADPNGVFKQVVKWIQGDLNEYTEEDIGEEPSKFDNSMIARLHLLDGRSATTERKINGKKISFYIKPLNHFRLIYESKTTAIDSHQSSEIVKLVKIFEYVKGARIVGKVNPDSKVTISTNIKTNGNRNFVYEKTIETKDGKFEFIVPYSTFGEDGRIFRETNFVVFAEPYKIKISDKEIEIKVTEEDILNGKEIKIKI